MVETRSSFPSELKPGIHAQFGQGYRDKPEQFSQLFDKRKSSDAYEEDLLIPGYGLAVEKGEGNAIAFDSTKQSWKSRYDHKTYALGIVVTQEEMEDCKYKGKVGRQQLSRRVGGRARALGRSFRLTKEHVAANVYNRVATSGYTGGDGVVLGSASHPNQIGTYSNILSVGSLPSEAALESMLIQIDQAKDDRGLQIDLAVKCLVAPTELQFVLTRLLESRMQPGTGNNDVNAIKLMGKIPKLVINNYLTDANNWFMRTDCPEGMQMFERIAFSTEDDNDFNTYNHLFKGRERYSFGWTDPRALYSSLPA